MSRRSHSARLNDGLSRKVDPLLSSKNKKIAGTLVAVAFRPFVGDAADVVGRAISAGPKDDIQRLMATMADSQDKGWRALELGLRGKSVLNKATSLFAADNGVVQDQIRAFLEAIEGQSLDQEHGPTIDENFKAKCLRELVTARKKGVIPGVSVPPQRFANEASVFSGATNPTELRDTEAEMLKYAGAELAVNGFDNLASYITLAPKDESPLLIVAVQYFFRRAVEEDPALSHMLQVQRIERINHLITDALGELDAGFKGLGDQLSSAFDSLTTQVSQVQEGVDEINDKIDEWQLQEAQRQEAIDAERKMMMAMLQQMSQQIAQLTNTPASQQPTVDVDDRGAVEKLRQKAEEAITSKLDSASDSDKEVVQNLTLVTKQFDTVSQRVFTHLPSSKRTTSSELMPTMSQNASGVFGNKKRSLTNRKKTLPKAKIELMLKEQGEAAQNRMVQVYDKNGSLVREVKTDSGGYLSVVGLAPGSYTVTLASPFKMQKQLEITPGQNVVEDWDIG